MKDYALRRECYRKPQSCDKSLSDIRDKLRLATEKYAGHSFVSSHHYITYCVEMPEPLERLRRAEARVHYLRNRYYPDQPVAMQNLMDFALEHHALPRSEVERKLNRHPVPLAPLPSDAIGALDHIRAANTRDLLSRRGFLPKNLRSLPAVMVAGIRAEDPAGDIADPLLAATALVKAITRYTKLQASTAPGHHSTALENEWLATLTTHYVSELRQLQALGCELPHVNALLISAEEYKALLDAGKAAGLTSSEAQRVLGQLSGSHETGLQYRLARLTHFQKKFGGLIPGTLLREKALFASGDKESIEASVQTAKRILLKYQSEKYISAEKIWRCCFADPATAEATVDTYAETVKQLISTHAAKTSLRPYMLAKIIEDRSDPESAILNAIQHRKDAREHYKSHIDVTSEVLDRCGLSANWKQRIDDYTTMLGSLRREFADHPTVDDEILRHYALYTPRKAKSNVYVWADNYATLREAMQYTSNIEDWMIRHVALADARAITNFPGMLQHLHRVYPSLREVGRLVPDGVPLPIETSAMAARNATPEEIVVDAPGAQLEMQENIAKMFCKLSRLEQAIVAEVFGLSWVLPEEDGYDRTSLEVMTGTQDLTAYCTQHIIPKLRA
jgi:hypothetical protein